jgi:hypothetical protein
MPKQLQLPLDHTSPFQASAELVLLRSPRRLGLEGWVVGGGRFIPVVFRTSWTRRLRRRSYPEFDQVPWPRMWPRSLVGSL